MARVASEVIGEGGRRIIFARVFDFLVGPEGTDGVDFVAVKYNSSIIVREVAATIGKLHHRQSSKLTRIAESASCSRCFR